MQDVSSEATADVDDGRRRITRHLSLKTRLVVGLVLLAISGLVIADVVIYNETRSYLVGQLSQQLESRAPAVLRALDSPSFIPGGDDGRLYELGLPPGTFGELLDPSGNASNPFRVADTNGKADAIPQLRSALPGSNANPSANTTVFSAGAQGGSTRYLVLAGAVSTGGTLVLAFPLTAIDATLGQLELIELLVTIGVVLGVAVLALLVVRVGLRPLGAIGLTAAAIAEGDLTRRVRRDDGRTEVGRLGRSVNAMLAKIEDAFDQRATSERRLRQFVSDASHELRTPITSIRGYAELYRRGAVSNEQDVRGAMLRIEGEAERMGVLVEELLLLARLDQGRPLERQTVDLVQVATDVVADASVVNPDRPLSVDAPQKLVLEGDELRLRQVLVNLVQNAVVHTPPETPVIVRARQEGASAVVEVEDGGPGIDPSQLDRIFERFYRVDSSRTRETGGTGLGLSIVVSIIEAHGGHVSVTSELGRGSTFRVVLPLVSPAPSANGAGQSDEHSDNSIA